MFAIATIENKIVLEGSELGADHLKHMMPMAKELVASKAAPKRIRHRGRLTQPILEGNIQGLVIGVIYSAATG